jgi:hypothetical protein
MTESQNVEILSLSQRMKKIHKSNNIKKGEVFTIKYLDDPNTGNSIRQKLVSYTSDIREKKARIIKG